MTVNYYKINPGGNITALVDRDFSKSKRITIAKRILKSDSTIEQVGFMAKPKYKAAVGRIEMMGGEFCGNATRCLAFLLRPNSSNRKVFFVESSGINYPIKARAWRDYAEISLPVSEFRIEDDLVCLPGIVHVVTKDVVDKDKAMEILRARNLLLQAAVGVISFAINKEKIWIKPYVWVRDTETLYEETSCASGSLALSYYLSQNSQQRTYVIRQPSNNSLCVKMNQLEIIIGGSIISQTKERLG